MRPCTTTTPTAAASLAAAAIWPTSAACRTCLPRTPRRRSPPTPTATSSSAGRSPAPAGSCRPHAPSRCRCASGTSAACTASLSATGRRPERRRATAPRRGPKSCCGTSTPARRSRRRRWCTSAPDGRSTARSCGTEPDTFHAGHTRRGILYHTGGPEHGTHRRTIYRLLRDIPAGAQ